MSKDLDLLLVSPGSQNKLYGKLSPNLAAIEPPLWAALLAAFVREKGFAVKILDAELDNLSSAETAEKIVNYNPVLAAVVVSGTNPNASTMNMVGAGAILKELKSRNASIKTLLTGLHPSALPERTLKEEEVDFICQGEGFYTITELLETIKAHPQNRSYKIKGLWYKEGGKIIANPRAELISNLDSLPQAAWELLSVEKYRAHNWHCYGRINKRQPYAAIYTSLGCPFKCTFCCINEIFGGSGIRYRSPEKVISEIDYLVNNYKVQNIKIIDEMFALNTNHVNAICDLIIERGYDLNIWAYARIDTVNKEMLTKMKKAGISWLAFGIESANQEVRDSVTKGKFSDSDIKRVIRMTKDAGIHIVGNYIFGLPEDNLETMQSTLDLAKELNCEYSNFYVAMAYPGSQLYEDALKEGLKLPESWLGYSQFGEDTLPLPTKYLSSAEVLRFRDSAFKEYHNGDAYLEMMEDKFGKQTVQHIRDMLKQELARRFA
ncbi:MAG: radical SAM protein [Candidatus Omnitrophota bacterium]